ncbi:UNVERIFIED_ORG: hypothetical protein J2Y84_001951 [Pseudomonas reinekei]|nr:hypothetical protein [Pseudomonas reinekei]
MPNSDLLPSLIFKINENQLALEAAIMELTLWVVPRGATQLGGDARDALEMIDKNEDFHQDDARDDDDAGVTTVCQNWTASTLKLPMPCLHREHRLREKRLWDFEEYC